MSKNMPAHPLGTLPIKVGRAFWKKSKDGTETSTMLLASVHGTGTAPDGAQVVFAVGGTEISVRFKYPGDNERDDWNNQHYAVNLNDVIDALHELNKRRRAEKFADAPPLEE